MLQDCGLWEMAVKDQTKKASKFYEQLESLFIEDNSPEVKLVKKGQYKEVFEVLEDSEALCTHVAG